LFEPRIFNKRELDFQKNSAVISGAQLHFRRLLWRWYLHMHSKYVNSTNGRQYLKEHGFSDIDSIWRKKILAVRRCFPSILAIFHWPCAVSTVLLLPVWNLTSYLNSAHPFPYKDVVISGARHHFRRGSWG